MLIPEIVSGGGGERRQVAVCAVDGFPSLDFVCPQCCRYDGDTGCAASVARTFRAMAFAQLTIARACGHRSLSERTACQALSMGFRSPVRRSTLAEANESRDWRIYASWRNG